MSTSGPVASPVSGRPALVDYEPFQQCKTDAATV